MLKCNNCGNEVEEKDKYCEKCGKLVNTIAEKNENISNRRSITKTLKAHKILLIIFIILLGLLIFILYQNMTIVRVPNIVGKTVKEAQSILEDLGLKIEKENEYTENMIITTQEPTFHHEVKRGTDISIKASTKEEIEAQKEAQRKEKEKNNRIESIIKQWADYVRDANNGNCKYESSRKYDTTDDGKSIYLIIYDTGSQYIEYRQLVAFNKDLTEITSTTKLYTFSYLSNGKEGANQQDQMEWEAEKLWGI